MHHSRHASESTAPRYKKWLVIAGCTLVSLFILLVLLSWLTPLIFRRQLSDKLKTYVRQSSKGVYKLEYDDLSLNLLRGSLQVTALRLTPDTAAVLMQKKRGKPAGLTATLRIKSIELSGIALIPLITSRKLKIDDFLIDQPFVELTDTTKKAKTENKKTLYQRLNNSLASIQINTIRIRNGFFSLINNTNPSHQDTQVSNFTLTVHAFLLDEHSENDSSRIYGSRQIEIESDSIRIPLKDPMYQFVLHGLKLSSADHSLQIRKAHLQPLYSKAKFDEKLGLAKDRLDFSYEEISTTSLDVRKLVSANSLIAQQFHIQKGVMDIYKDKRFPLFVKNRTGTYPHQLLLKAPVKIHIDTIYLKDVTVMYGEFSDKTYQRGKIQFDKTHGTLTNITNDSTGILRNNHCRIDVESKFMNNGNLLAYFDFDLASSNGAFSCGGKMKNFEMKEVNSMIQSLAKANVKSGNLTLLDFDIKGTDYTSYIRMQMHYNHLKLELLKLDKDSGELKKRSFLSNLINNLITNENNPKGNKPARIGEATLQREATDSFFKFIWLTIQEPIKRIVTGKDDRKKNSS